MTYEKTRKGNPLQLTVEQHFHTAHAIAKFYNTNGNVEVKDINTGEVLQRHKRAKIFSTKRNWDERAEKGYMAHIEADFHNQIDSLNLGRPRDDAAISKYLALWRLRHKFHLERSSDAPLFGIDGEYLTKEQQEILEKRGIGYINERAEIPARQLTGIQIQIGVDQLMQTLGGIKWGLLHSKNSQFLCADCYHRFLFIPVSPVLALAGNLPDQELTDAEVSIANHHSVNSASQFYFGSYLEKCPIA
ncbi:hypothetical protein [Rheinheimera sp. EpRS3]|uniref:hypothetical protein n=1 Tax=Rheinheimera sp. EpRS3 TaxID=1712383 RepID=UPI000747D21E|nr:hypothetical protein [Rheinheimera sp. EpRS3]KUM52727.1 hypothetical protein AR688_10660 [Rheinheimera sp. EpRS3]